MEPVLKEGRVVIGIRWFRRLEPGDIVIIRHQGLEKIKRVTKIRSNEIYVTGDNKDLSTDSRNFGWLNRDEVASKIILSI